MCGAIFNAGEVHNLYIVLLGLYGLAVTYAGCASLIADVYGPLMVCAGLPELRVTLCFVVIRPAIAVSGPTATTSKTEPLQRLEAGLQEVVVGDTPQVMAVGWWSLLAIHVFYLRT